MLICVDPGHSIDTAGKCAPDKSYYEHEFNLDVGLRLKSELERCGFEVVMTRDTEKEKTHGTEAQILAARCKIANDAKADYFISVHTNAYGDGIQWTSPQGMSTHIIAKGGQAEKLADAIRAEAIPLLGCVDRGTRVDNFAVVRDTKMPAVLIEYGFHTNQAEVEKLKTPEYRQLCAVATAKGICRHTGILYIPETAPEVPEASGSGKMITLDELRAMGYTGIIFE